MAAQRGRMLRIADRKQIDVVQMVLLDDEVDAYLTSGLPALACFQVSYRKWIPVERLIPSAAADVRLLVTEEV
jgi:hypothetical protein